MFWEVLKESRGSEGLFRRRGELDADVITSHLKRKETSADVILGFGNCIVIFLDRTINHI
jgi:hypothetical protein